MILDEPRGRSCGHKRTRRCRREPTTTGGDAVMLVPEVKFRVLGAVAVLRLGQPVALSGQVLPKLLGRLLLAAGGPVTRDELAKIIWDGSLPEHPRQALNSLISRLRQVLGPDVVQTVNGCYRIAADPASLDLLRFDNLVLAAGQATADGRPQAAVLALDDALGLWEHPVLPGAFARVLGTDGARMLTERYLSAQEKRAELRLRLGQHQALIPELTGLVTAHPFREVLTGQLMLALYRSGRQAEALMAYHALQRKLREDLGVDPGVAVQRLQLGILRRDSALTASGTAARVPLPAVPSPAKLAGTPYATLRDILLKDEAALQTVMEAHTAVRHRCADEACEVRAAMDQALDTIRRVLATPRSDAASDLTSRQLPA